jgi:hypothetical protein
MSDLETEIRWLTVSRLAELVSELPGDARVFANDLETEIRWLTVSRLAELVSELPGDARVFANDLGNLIVTDPATNEPILCVDFTGEGSVEPIKAPRTAVYGFTDQSYALAAEPMKKPKKSPSSL